MSASGSETARGLTVAPGKGRPSEGHPRPGLTGLTGLTGRAGWWLWAAGLAAAGVLLFTVYLRLTNTCVASSATSAGPGSRSWPSAPCSCCRYIFDSPQAPLSTPVLEHFGHSDVAGP